MCTRISVENVTLGISLSAPSGSHIKNLKKLNEIKKTANFQHLKNSDNLFGCKMVL